MLTAVGGSHDLRSPQLKSNTKVTLPRPPALKSPPTPQVPHLLTPHQQRRRAALLADSPERLPPPPPPVPPQSSRKRRRLSSAASLDGLASAAGGGGNEDAVEVVVDPAEPVTSRDEGRCGGGCRGGSSSRERCALYFGGLTHR